MGLSERKTKQRIPDDPRNLCWADDAARFGSNYLAKFGWDGSTGLGVAGEGRKSHIKVSQKLDLLGIGAGQQEDPDGIAWKQNKDFECLLQRLNDASAAETNQTLEGEINQDTCIIEKKRKHKEDGESKTERKKKRKADVKLDDEGQSSSSAEPATIQSETTVVEVKQKAAIIPRHRAHRARAINAKNISSKSAAHISEILGIAPIPSLSSSAIDSDRSRGKLTSLTDEIEIEKITTSTKSVADYFKEKLNARSSSTIVSTSTTPRDSDDSYDTPRMGLGSRTARLEILTATEEVEQETQRMGLSMFSAFSSSLICEKTLKDLELEDPGTMPKTDVKKRRKTKDEEMEKEGGTCEGRDETKEREERKRNRKLDKGKKDHVEPQDSDDDLKKQEKRKRKAEHLQASVTPPHADTPECVKKPQKRKKEKKKGPKSIRDEHTIAHVS